MRSCRAGVLAIRTHGLIHTSDTRLPIPSLVQSPNEVYSFKRPVDLSLVKGADSGAHALLRGGLRSSPARRDNCVGLLSANQVVRALPPGKVPLREIYPKGQSSGQANEPCKLAPVTDNSCSRPFLLSLAQTSPRR